MTDLYAPSVAVVMDLEWTSWEGAWENGWSRPGELREVVQIGAVKLDFRKGLEEIGAFECLVRPKVNPTLSAYFVNLTGIAQADLDRDGLPFAEAMDSFTAFVGSDAEVIYANGYDAEVLADNHRIHGCLPRLPQDLFVNIREDLAALGGYDARGAVSSELPAILGLEHQDSAHQGLADARAIASALRLFQ